MTVRGERKKKTSQALNILGILEHDSMMAYVGSDSVVFNTNHFDSLSIMQNKKSQSTPHIAHIFPVRFQPFI